MPELPDIEAYLHAMRPRIEGRRLLRVRRASPFVLRTVDPPPAAVEGCAVTELRRIGKRIAIGLEGELWLIIHLMIAGRLHWRASDATLAGRGALLGLDFAGGTLVLTEAGAKRRASLHIVRAESGLAAHDRGGIEVRPIYQDSSPPRAARTTRSSGRSPIPASSPASGMPIRTRSCKPHSSHL